MENFDAASTASANQLVLTALIGLLEPHIPDIRLDLVGVFEDALAKLDLTEPGEQRERRRKVLAIALSTTTKADPLPNLTLVPRD